MRLLIVAVMALMLAGCASEPSPFIGEWDSKETSSVLRIKDGGECRYVNSAGIGRICSWEAIDKSKVRITVESPPNIFESTGTLFNDEMHIMGPHWTDVFSK